MDVTAAAHHGPGWRPRPGRQEDDLAPGGAWAPLRVSRDCDPLTDVALHLPPAALLTAGPPDALQHLERIDHDALRRDLDGLAGAYRALGVTVHELPAPAPPGGNPYRGANAVYARDLLWMTRAGAVIPRMASSVRAGEELQAHRLCARLGVPVARTIGADGLFEGADAAWLRPDLVAVGLGVRTNGAGARQVEDEARAQGARVLRLSVPPGVQHLLGVLQVLDADLLAARTSLLRPGEVRHLRDLGFTVLDVPESDEVRTRLAFNFVTVAPRAVLLPDGCPDTAALLARHGVECAARVPIPELAKGAGGPACATGILARTSQD
ncbi:dimethylarginine dimethylaminohydrolase family protein [Kitasatospora sp. NRRL B-11411]|uniref:dimethylarginine dimethylaminohydrolase family protein n=1 Tax=Kitasatospora sp. NRRL B-11411 TaxID=1463822 RepID=UPI00068E40DD|nr:arginine deiminase family protein [Kitasatospora sp. NRRL B-11411]WNW38873.1 arginine deiminase family protein [Streptomyces sp. Li-HN-5-13]